MSDIHTGLSMIVTNRTATFVANGRIVLVSLFDSEGLGTSIPPVPRKNGFVGEWTPTVLGDQDVTIEAVYRPVRVIYEQYDGSVVVRDYGQPAPEVLPVEGCVGEWEPFLISDCDIEVRPRYKGPRHTVRLVVEGERVSDVICPRMGFPTLPPVPRVAGYKGYWETYIPKEGVVVVNALYEPLRYDYEMGIGRIVTTYYGDPAPEVPTRQDCKTHWGSTRTSAGDYRMSVRFAFPPVLHGFGEEPDEDIETENEDAPEEVEEPATEVVPEESVVEEQAVEPTAVEEPTDAMEPRTKTERPMETAAEAASESVRYTVPEEKAVPGFDDLHREKVRLATEELGFISEHWRTVEEDEQPAPSVNSINLSTDTQEGTEWERLADMLSPLQKEYLMACIGMRGKPSEVLRKYGSTMLIVETGINALAEDLIGDPLLEEGEVDPDYASDIEEVLKDGN